MCRGGGASKQNVSKGKKKEQRGRTDSQLSFASDASDTDQVFTGSAPVPHNPAAQQQQQQQQHAPPATTSTHTAPAPALGSVSEDSSREMVAMQSKMAESDRAMNEMMVCVARVCGCV